SVGIDIGGTNTAIGIVDEAGNVVVKGGVDTPSHGDAERYVKEMGASVKDMAKKLKLTNPDSEIMGIGIGAPNGNYYSGTIEYAPNLSFKGVVRLIDLLREYFPSMNALALTNDANAAALGEMIYGGAKEMRNFVMFTLGTGVGSG